MIHNKINYSYDAEFDSLFIFSCNDYNYDESIELNPNIILDFDTDNIPVAIELLSVSKLFEINKSYFNNINDIMAKITISKNLIELSLVLTMSIGEEIVIKESDSIGINELLASNSNIEMGLV